jgi:hypothetical protein
MKIKHLIFTVLLAAASAVTSQPADNPYNRNQPAETVRPEPLVGSVPNQDRGPSFSSPEAPMAPNGDRIGHYPPYYHPEQTGHGHGHR